MSTTETLLRDALALPEERRRELVGSLLRSLPAPQQQQAAQQQQQQQQRPVAPAGADRDDDTAVTWEGAQSFLED